MLPARQGKWIPISVCKINKRVFLFPVLLNTIIERNLVVSKFSPQAGVLHSPSMYMFNNINNTVQVRKGKMLAKLVNLEMGGEKTKDRAGTTTLPLMFLGLVRAMAFPTKGEKNLKQF